MSCATHGAARVRARPSRMGAFIGLAMRSQENAGAMELPAPNAVERVHANGFARHAVADFFGHVSLAKAAGCPVDPEAGMPRFALPLFEGPGGRSRFGQRRP